MMTRRMGGAATAETSGTSAAGKAGAGGGAADDTAGAPAGAGTGAGGATAATGARATTGFVGAAVAIAGRCCAVVDAAGGAAVTGGRATTGPAGGFAAMAGGCAGGAVTIGGAWRGCGITTRRTGASGLGGATGAAAAGAGGALAAGFCGAASGFATAAGGVACARGAGRSASSLRCWIAFRTSPGFDTRDQSIFGAVPLSALADEPPLRLLPRWKCERTRCASSASSELECVFGSVTPTSLSTSRMALLLTSSSLAKSLMRTLLIRPFTWHSACRPSAVHSNLLVCGFTCRSI